MLLVSVIVGVGNTVFSGVNVNVGLNVAVGKQVSPLQLIALGRYLTLIGERQINQALSQQDEVAAQRRIIVPGMDTDGLRL